MVSLMRIMQEEGKSYIMAFQPAHPAAHLGTFEGHVLQKMGCAIVVVIFIAAASIDPNTNRCSLSKGVGL